MCRFMDMYGYSSAVKGVLRIGAVFILSQLVKYSTGIVNALYVFNLSMSYQSNTV